MSLSLLGAFLGGVLTLLSPCSVMLLPAFFAYAFSSPGALLARTGVFFLGLATALVPLGLLAGTLGAWVNQNRFTLVTIASALVILLGVAMLLGIRLPGVIQQRGAESASIASVFALGTVYGLAGVCAGPMLGAALAFAAFGGNALLGGLILLVFAAGMTVPLLLLALLWERLPAVRRLVRPRELVIGRWRNTWTNIVGGIITVGIGVLLLVTQGTTSLGGVLGATDQARLEAGVMQFANGVPDWAVAVLFVALAGTWLTVFFARRGRARRAQALAELG
ncbi:cytochrome c biogenesis transmembrane protein [Leucobacter luti]|uniref:Cytochrome c biogenesis transmembrane protein n=1 Tax=Leucobacter luti TaxID=340320 RepID=A0A4R6S4F6_9MICO|nr:cytochrome c biogenesis protein CcdA [Leucobacter luti]TDP94560.1 cytochrome c biogenesis transmembrane protein [Leucobacter luti]